MSKTKKLRELIARPGVLTVPETPFPQAAAIAEFNGHECAYIGGASMAQIHYMFDDFGLILHSEMAHFAGAIASVISIPLISDADQCGETPLNTFRAVRQFEAAGVAGIHIEDTVEPKHMFREQADHSGDRLLSKEEMVCRLSAAVEARRDPNFVIIARSDTLYNAGRPVFNATMPGNAAVDDRAFDELIARGQAYAKAGADMFMCSGLPMDKIDVIAREVPMPLLGINFPRDAVKDTRLCVNIATGTLRPMLETFEELVIALKETGQYGRPTSPSFNFDAYAQFTDNPAYRRIAAAWAKVHKVG